MLQTAASCVNRSGDERSDSSHRAFDFSPMRGRTFRFSEGQERIYIPGERRT
jgi:hypothetical protein